MFGQPAGYAGRRMFACVAGDSLVVKLPREVARRELAHGRERVAAARPYVRDGREMKDWVRYAPRSARDMQRLAAVLEVAARHAARQADAGVM